MRIDALAQEAAGTSGGPIDMDDAVVFDEIYRSYFPPLCLFVENYVPEKDAEDVIENLFLKLWKKRYQFRDTQLKLKMARDQIKPIIIGRLRFYPHNYLWPIPISELDVNQNLQQNPGYN